MLHVSSNFESGFGLRPQDDRSDHLPAFEHSVCATCFGERDLFSDPNVDVSGHYVVNQELKALTRSLDIIVEHWQVESGEALASGHQATGFDRFSGATG